MTNGICKLTGKKGKLVKAHILPKALTRPEWKGAPLIQFGSGKHPSKRWSSWYDPALVTAEGEAILAEYDNWGVAELRRLKLVWSSWGPMTSLAVADFDQFTPTHGIRAIETDPVRMRLFFLSLLWRAAESELPECAEVKLKGDERQQLRQMLLDKNPEPADFFPIMLVQLSTMGVVQNHGPIEQLKSIPSIGDHAPPPVWIYRFYLDGLVAHFHRQEDGHATAAELGNLVVGNGPRVLVNTVTYEKSWQHENLQTVLQESLPPR